MAFHFSIFTVLLLCSNVIGHLVHQRVSRQTTPNPCQSFTPNNQPAEQQDVSYYSRSTICAPESDPKKLSIGFSARLPTRRPIPTIRTPSPMFTSSTPRTTTLNNNRISVKNKYSVCGKSSRNAVKIVGGRDATLGDWPWMAAIGYRTPANPGPLFKCGGTLISDIWVLTAGHCVVNIGSSTVTVARLGELDLTENSNDGASPIDVPIEKIIPHPAYSASPLLNDIALMRLKTAVTFTALIRPLCLPKQTEHKTDIFYSNKTPFIAGWGYTQSRNHSSRSYHLKEAQIDIVDRETCVSKFKLSALNASLIDEKVLCASRGGVDSCQGDSGGPLMMPIKASYYLIGIVSYGIDCANLFFPGVYTRVAYYFDWIKSTTGIEF